MFIMYNDVRMPCQTTVELYYERDAGMGCLTFTIPTLFAYIWHAIPRSICILILVSVVF